MRETVVVRLPNWLGDTVMAAPSVRALREGLPSARLVLVGPWATVFAGQEMSDLLIEYPRSWGGRIARADTLRSLSVDTAILLPHSFEAALAARYWGARRRIGFAGGGRRWMLTEAVPFPAPRQHQTDEYGLLVERLRIAIHDRQPRLMPPNLGSEDRATARKLLKEAGVPVNSREGPIIGIHIGAEFGSSKLWPLGQVIEFCRGLRRDGGIPVLLGARRDVPFAEAVTRSTDALSLAGRDSGELLPAVLSELNALVCGDTGVAHLAAALETPVVALFGPTDPTLSAPRGRVSVLRHPVPCSPCFLRTCPIDHPCLGGIEAREVREALHNLLTRRTEGGEHRVARTLDT